MAAVFCVKRKRGSMRTLRAALAADRPAGATRPGGRALGNLQGERGKPLPYERNARFRVCAGEPLGAPAEMWAAFQEPTLIRHGFAVPPSPLEGEGLCGRLIAAPTVHRKAVGAHSMRPPEFAPVPLVRKRQARERNRSSPNFPPAQAPSGAGMNLDTHSNFARRKFSACSKG